MKPIIGLLLHILWVLLFASGVTLLLVAAFGATSNDTYRILLILGSLFTGIGMGAIIAFIANSLLEGIIK